MSAARLLSCLAALAQHVDDNLKCLVDEDRGVRSVALVLGNLNYAVVAAHVRAIAEILNDSTRSLRREAAGLLFRFPSMLDDLGSALLV